MKVQLTATGLTVNASFSSALSTESACDSNGSVNSLSQPVHTPHRSQCRPLPAGGSMTLNTIFNCPGLCNGELQIIPVKNVHSLVIGRKKL